MVRINLRSSFGYRGAGGTVRYYGPGENVEVPEGLAFALGKTPIAPPPAPPAEPPPATPPESTTFWPFLSDEQRQALADAGYTSQDALDAASDDDLLSLPTIGAATVRKLRGGA